VRGPWRRVYAEVARLGALSARRVPVKGASPRPRASHSLNLVAGWLVLFGGGCEGGNNNHIISLLFSCPKNCFPSYKGEKEHFMYQMPIHKEKN
jgi:hypothetical protein